MNTNQDRRAMRSLALLWRKTGVSIYVALAKWRRDMSNQKPQPKKSP